MATYTVRQHDTAPVVTDTLEDSTGAAVNLTGATVKFHMASWDLATVVIANGTVTNIGGGALDASGGVQYQWQAADTLTRGAYKAEWQVTFSGGAVESWPNDGYAVVDIPADLA